MTRFLDRVHPAVSTAVVGHEAATGASVDAAARLRAAGLRVTGPRLAVLAVLAEAPESHLDVDSVARAARERMGALTIQAVYEILRAFADAGFVRRIEPAGAPALFETRAGDNHHHVVCRSCGAIRNIDCLVGERPCLTPSDAHGFALDEAEVTFWGLCPDCSDPAAHDHEEESA